VKKYLFLVLLALAVLLPPSTHSQSSGTSLVMSARWDDGSRIQGTVTLTQATSTGETPIFAQTLVKGSASVSEPLLANSLYYVTLASANGVQLVKFPVTTALVNPANLKSAQIALVCRKADNSLQSAQISVSMGF
jgi:hypothetical protein